MATFNSLPAALQMNKREGLLTEINKGRSKKRVLGVSPKRGGGVGINLFVKFPNQFFLAGNIQKGYEAENK